MSGSSAFHLWAKSARDGPGHSLLGHLLDVGLAAEYLLSSSAAQRMLHLFAEDLGITPEEAERLVIVLIALHDLGKATPAFQAKWPQGAPEEALRRPVKDIPHGTASAILLYAWLRDKEISKRVAMVLAHAVGIHHGVLLASGYDDHTRYDDRSIAEGNSTWDRWREELCAAVVEAFGPLPELAGRRPVPRARSWAWLAGLTAMADWIGSGLDHRPPIGDVRGYLVERRSDIGPRLREIEWSQGDDWWQEPPQPERFESWFGFKPRRLQQAVETSMAEDARGPGLWVIEAPMGEGKTEAAYFTMVRVPEAQGAYVALPTQATSDALHARLATFVQTHKRRPVEIALVHGSARHRPAALEHDPEAVDGEGQEAQLVRASWFSTGRRELLAELGVGTVDQALLAVLPTRHHFVRLAALAGKVVVFDEVHAYEAYTEGLIVELVRWLAASGSTVMLMSATLPLETREQLVQAYREGAGWSDSEAIEASYPRLTAVTVAGTRVRTFQGERLQSVELRTAPYEVAALGVLLANLVAQGGAVGVVVNQVGRAQALYAWCREQGMPASILHARFPMRERKEREAALVRDYGSESTGERRGLVIATQVIEQSLDIDFDVLVTDLAPIDLVLQRLGRMHRHGERDQRGNHRTPVLYVAGLAHATEDGPEPEAMESVYQPYLLWRSWAILRSARTVELPDDIDTWVQRVYSDAHLDELTPFADRVAADQHLYETKRQGAANEVKAWATAGPFDDATQAWSHGAASEDEARRPGMVRAPTRLGESSVSVVPVIRVGKEWHLPGGEERIPVSSARVPAAWAEAAASCQLRIGRLSLVRKLNDVHPPAWWTKNNPLKFLIPLELDEAGVSLIDPGVRLDLELGLVYPEPKARERSTM